MTNNGNWKRELAIFGITFIGTLLSCSFFIGKYLHQIEINTAAIEVIQNDKVGEKEHQDLKDLLNARLDALNKRFDDLMLELRRGGKLDPPEKK
jgi:hypothetical protein